jgi:hypothetical protein
MKKALYLGVAVAALTAFMTGAPVQVRAQVAIDNDDIGGVVTGPNGPEAGVWVIAETKDLQTRYAKMVVTDDQGRYVVPDLPKAKYKIWVRGYGLVDSQKVDAEPGKQVNLQAVRAQNDAAAAQYYPAIYWYTMLKIPSTDQFGGKTDIPERIKQIDWLNLMKNNGCVGCHQMGTLATRTIPQFFGPSSKDAWMRRTQAGQAGTQMVGIIAGQLAASPLAYFTDWTDRIAKGELPHAKPERPSGAERNIVVSTWDWSDEKHYLHDLVSTDRRNPTINAKGPVFGQPEYSMDFFPTVDPVKNTSEMHPAPIRDKDMHEMLGPGHAAAVKPVGPSAYWGDEKIWTAHFNNHNAMIDQKGRVWMTAAFRDEHNEPAFCKKGSDQPSAKLAPLERSARMLTIYDPKTQKVEFVDTCFTTHHLNFAYDNGNTLWTSSGGGGGVVGWVNTKVWDETHDPAKAQGWTELILDTNGDGKRGEYTAQNQPFDPSKDRRITQVFYAVSPAQDGSVWGTLRLNPGSIARINPGSNPPETALTELYNVPLPGFGPRGGDVDSKGVYWVSLGSGHIGEFNRSKCKAPLNGPKALGDHCPEGWSFHKYPGPGFAGIGDNSAESSYYSWVDQHNIFGLGNDTPMSTANLQDGLVAYDKANNKMVLMRVPYPMGFFAKGMDGRIDDANAGWKGRGVWSSSGDRAPWQVEGGKGMRPMAVHFQLRPDPLAH